MKIQITARDLLQAKQFDELITKAADMANKAEAEMCEIFLGFHDRTCSNKTEECTKKFLIRAMIMVTEKIKLQTPNDLGQIVKEWMDEQRAESNKSAQGTDKGESATAGGQEIN